MQASTDPVLFLDIPNIGSLFIDKVLVYYEEPVLFTCVSRSGQFFLVNCLEICVEHREWAIVQTSQTRLIKALKGNLSIYTMLKHPENGFILIAKEEYSSEIPSTTFKTILEHEIIDDYLPDMDSSIEFIQDVALKPFDKPINQVASDEQRNILDVTFENTSFKTHEVPINESSKILQGIWDTYASLLPIPNDSRREIPNMSLAGIAPGSLTLRFKIDEPNPKLFPELNDSSVALSEMICLIQKKGNEEDIKQKFQELQSPKASKSFSSFLDTLSKTDFNIKFEFAVHDKYFHASIDKYEAIEYSNLFKTEITEKETQIELEGDLVSYNSDSHKIRFAFSDTSNNFTTVTADLDDSLKDVKLLIPSRIKGLFQKASKRKKLLDALTYEYKLLSYAQT